jgi:hypothetical protein
MGKKQPWKMREEEKVMKISLVLALMLASGIIFFPMAGDAQMRQGMMGGGMSGGMTGPGQMEQNGPDGKYTLTLLKSTGNPNLKLGKITEKGENFEAYILTRNDSLVDKILVNKDTGEIHSEY